MELIEFAGFVSREDLPELLGDCLVNANTGEVIELNWEGGDNS